MFHQDMGHPSASEVSATSGEVPLSYNSSVRGRAPVPVLKSVTDGVTNVPPAMCLRCPVPLHTPPSPPGALPNLLIHASPVVPFTRSINPLLSFHLFLGVAGVCSFNIVESTV